MITEDMDSGVESSSISGHESPNATAVTAERGDEQLSVNISDTTLLPTDDEVTRSVFEAEPIVNPTLHEESEDEDIDETLGERLYGLTEMFPQFIRNGVHTLSCGSVSGVKWFYGFSRSAAWIFFSSSIVLIAPVIFEVERSQMQKQVQKQMLLGPGVGMGTPSPSGMMPMPSPPPPQR